MIKFVRLALAATLALGFTSNAGAEVLGYYQNEIHGMNILGSEAAGKCAEPMRIIIAHSKEGKVLHTGCWFLHNMTVVVLWDRGPARAIAISSIEWPDKDDPAKKGESPKPKEELKNPKSNDAT